jgi:hypothetical protein
MKKLQLIVFLGLMFIFSRSFAQGVGINSDESDPDPSAILDVKSTNQGMLVPRMSVIEAYAISNPAEGLLIYATDVQSFLYFKGGNWNYLTSEFSYELADFDFDTKITTGGILDDDTIRFYVKNTEVLKIDSIHIIPMSANIFIGEKAGQYNTTGTSNIAIGRGALNYNDSISGLVAIGDSALFYNYSTGDPIFYEGEQNTAVGNKALMQNYTGSFNTALGYETLKQNIAGTANTAIGAKALHNMNGINNISESLSNTAVGAFVMEDNITGSYNTSTGVYSLWHNINGNNNCAYGYAALVYNSGSGSNNCAFGKNSLANNYNGSSNVAVGYYSLLSNQSGYSNIAVGTHALYTNITMSNLVAIGDSALYNNLGTGNVAVGSKSLFANNSGYGNTAVGFESGYTNTTGGYNTALGYQALYSNDNGIRNTAVGMLAGSSSVSGYYNTIVGAYANTSAGNFSNSVAIGDAALITASSQIRLGDAGVNSIGGYANWTNISDKRFKTNVKQDVPGLEFIMLLNPVTYNLNISAIDNFLGMDDPEKRAYHAQSEKSEIIYSGFLAQDVEAAARSVGYDFSGVDAPKNDQDTYGLRYAEFVVPLVKAVQEQQVLIEEMKAELESLKQQLNKD